MAFDIENYLDAFAIAAPQIYKRANYRRTLARLVMTVFMMREDRKIRKQEVVQVQNIARAKLELNAEDAKALCDELCEENEHEPSLDVLASYIKEHTTPVERADCIREIWEIAVCDNELHTCENTLAKRCAELLEVDIDEATWLKELAVATHSDDLTTTS